ncbi:glycosyltransferase [Vulcanisaeta souniana]|uniref:glycosyltransferase n=1 Tax=Vulcanisaeta souniana TaxID=164452 RepID=UPI001FB4CB14|nr:glycosyltransferase [Vulcanisaeta souniana]
MVSVCFVTFTRNSGCWLRGGLLDNVVDIVDEVVVVDGYSSDDTVEIAKSYGARVFQRKPRGGYVEPDRMFAIRQCNNDWVLYLDTDERLNTRLRRDLKEIIDKAIKNNYSAVMINRYNYHIKSGNFIFDAGFPDPQIRIFNKYRVEYKGIIHEFPKVHGRIMKLAPEYAIIHLVNDLTPLNKKDVIYAYVERLDHTYKRSRLYSAFTHLKPFTILSAWVILYGYFTVRQLMARKPVNIVGLMNNLRVALYKHLALLLIVTRGRKLDRIANAINEHGLIKLLEHSEIT